MARENRDAFSTPDIAEWSTNKKDRLDGIAASELADRGAEDTLTERKRSEDDFMNISPVAASYAVPGGRADDDVEDDDDVDDDDDLALDDDDFDDVDDVDVDDAEITDADIDEDFDEDELDDDIVLDDDDDEEEDDVV